MKKISWFISVLIGWFFISGCGGGDGHEKNPFLNASLAGSISYYYGLPEIKMEGTYEGIPKEIENFNSVVLLVRKLSKTEVSFRCLWDNGKININIPYIPVSGEPYNATLNYQSTETEIKNGDIIIYPVRTTIDGWVFEEGYAKTRTSFRDPQYEFEFKLNFLFEDGKDLHIKLTPKQSQY